MDKAFGLDAFSLDDRMRLFTYVTVDLRETYVWALRAFDRARANYHVLLHTNEVAAELEALAADFPECPRPSGLELPRLLDALVDWGVLDRTQDATRATTLAEYRNRHSVYQFTEVGYRAHRAVESVLNATLSDANLSRLVFSDILDDLHALATANERGDADEIYRKLNRLDGVLKDMAERAARFYLMLGDLGRGTETTAEVFLAHKDALLAHLRDFHLELQRYVPLLRQAVEAVELTGVDRMIEAAAEADERVFRSPAERWEDWRLRWHGMRSWFKSPGHDRACEADRLGDATVGAISDVLALLRRVTEARRGGVSRESQLRHLAAWFAAAPTEQAAHALFDVVFQFGSPRHVGVAHAAADTIASRSSWWDAPAVELSRTLVETGRPPGPGRPAAIVRDEAGRARLRERQLAEQRQLTEAAGRLADQGIEGSTLDEPQTRVLLRLLDAALLARSATGRGTPFSAVSAGVRLTLLPAAAVTTVRTVRGLLHVDGFALKVTAARAIRPRVEPSTEVVEAAL